MAKPRGLMTFETQLNAHPSLTETYFLIYVQKYLHVQCVRCQIHIKTRRTTKPVTRLKLTSAGNMQYNLCVMLKTVPLIFPA